MNSQHRERQTIAVQAARWIDVLEKGGPREHAEFASWVKTSPEHVKEFLLMMALEKEFEGVDAERSFDVDELLKRTAHNVIPLQEATPAGALAASSRTKIPARKTALQSKTIKIGALAASIALAIGTAWVVQHDSQLYSTVYGEQRTFTLPDGSTLQLSPKSQVKITYTAKIRDLRLLSGEASFKVEPDVARRPFRVHTGNTLIEDIGTHFHVYRRPHTTLVSVMEGAVKISNEPQLLDISFNRNAGPSEKTLARQDFKPLREPTLIKAGEEVRIAGNGKLIRRGTMNTSQVTLPQPRRLVFSGDTLADIVEDFNRYNGALQIEIDGDALGGKLFSGTFDISDPQSLASYLRETEGLVVISEAGRIRIRASETAQ